MLVDVPPPPTPSHIAEEEEPTRTPLPRYGFIFVNIVSFLKLHFLYVNKAYSSNRNLKFQIK